MLCVKIAFHPLESIEKGAKGQISDISKILEVEENEDPISYDLSSHSPRKAGFFAELIRGHWGGCEIRNHWVRDAIFQEDDTRPKRPNLNGKLAILRGALISLKARLVPDKSWPFIRAFCKTQISADFLAIGPFFGRRGPWRKANEVQFVTVE